MRETTGSSRRMEEMVVRQSSVSCVTPSHSPPPYTYFLSNLDLVFASSQIYMQSIYFFRSPAAGEDRGSTPSASIAESLKHSLSQALSVYPLLAGRLREKKTEGGRRMEVEVNGEGVTFIEAMTEAAIDEWPDLSDCEIEDQLNPKPFVSDIFTAPLIQVQVTMFACGAMALGFSSLHVISDGLAALEFMKAWGEIHRGVPISTPPQFQSILLLPRDPPTVRIAMADELFSAFKPPDMPPSYLLSIQTHLHSVRFRDVIFRMDREMINRCKADVEGGAYAYGPSSSFEAISALLWTAVTRAREVDDAATTTHILSVNIRKKHDPPLPDGFFGNAVILNPVTAIAREIKSHHISFAASLLHKALQVVNEEMIQSAIDWIELRLKQEEEIGVGFDISTGSNMISSSFVNLLLYEEISFGRRMDQFVFSSTGDRDSPTDGVVHVMPAPPGAGSEGSRELKLRLRQDHLDRLLRDPQFTQYFPKLKANLMNNNGI